MKSARHDKILELIARLHREENITIILVSHSMDDVAEYADRILVMDNSHLVFDDVPKNVFAYRNELTEMGLDIPEVTKVLKLIADKGVNIRTDAITIEEGLRACYEILR